MKPKQPPPKMPPPPRRAVPHIAQPGHARRTPSGAAQPSRPPAPPVYRPQPPRASVQPKTATPAPATPKAAPARPPAPPVYRPQPTPRVLQRLTSERADACVKTHARGTVPPVRPNEVAKGRAAVAPAPAARPTPRVLQAKQNAGARAAAGLKTPAPRPATSPAPRPANNPPPARRGAVQRFIAKDGHPAFLYMPDTVATNATFDTSMQALVGDYSVRKMSWEDMRDKVVWPGRWKVNQARLPEWAGANLGVGKSQDQHDPVPMALEGVATPTSDEVKRQFEDETAVYRYDSWKTIGGDEAPEKLLLLNAHDMREAGMLPKAYVYGQACVLQALESFNVKVPGVKPPTHAATDWHDYCVGKGLDYRTDSHYIRLYVGELRYKLKNNVVMRWDDIDWGAMGGNGNYLVGTYAHGAPVGSATGHMIGVVVAGGVVTQTHDQQNLTKPYFGKHNVHVRYVFKM